MESSPRSITDHATAEPLVVVAYLLCATGLVYLLTHVTSSRPLLFGVFVGIGVFVPRLQSGHLRIQG